MSKTNGTSSFKTITNGDKVSAFSKKKCNFALEIMKRGFLALSPLLVFIMLYLVTSLIVHDFYKVPITVAFLLSCIYAIAVTNRVPLRKRIDIFSRGAANSQMMLMIWIFIMAGAFAHTAKTMGSVDATVVLTLSLMPSQMLLAGLFLAACFISLSIGTSVGTIVALTPIAAGLAQTTGASVPLLVAVVVGGSFFGDNLSFISDTTITATTTQGCQQSDKFKVNSFIVIPAAIAVFVLYVFLGSEIRSPQQIPEVEYSKVIPYLVVLVTAAFGLNVMVVLAIGLLLASVIGLLNGSFDLFGCFGAMGEGIVGMGELIIITMLAGGMLELIKYGGGITFLIRWLTLRIKSKRGAELSIAALVSLVNVCTANNTVAIITVGGIARQISERYGVDSRKSASILDTFSCFAQGLIPYGAQLLMAAGLASLSPTAILPYLYYPFAIGIAALAAIIVRYPRKYS